jgi:hypothetical protein
VAKDKSVGGRAAVWRAVMRFGFIRRLYAKRLLAYMEKSKRKKRPLPNELRELDIAMSRLPESQRRAALEEALAGQGAGGPAMGRQLRRASSRQSRQSGKGGTHRRPGAMRTRDNVPPPRPAGAAPRPSRPKSKGGRGSR